MLTAAVGVGMETMENAYEISKISKDLDLINLMTYDFHGSWEDFIGHNAPLTARPDEDAKNKKLNVKFVVDYWLSEGASKDQLMLGMATYGRTYRLGKVSRNSPGDSAVGPGDHGKYSGEGGFLTYYEICNKINGSDWILKYDVVQQVPYAFKKRQWVSFDDVKSLKLKVRLNLYLSKVHAKQNHIACRKICRYHNH